MDGSKLRNTSVTTMESEMSSTSGIVDLSKQESDSRLPAKSPITGEKRSRYSMNYQSYEATRIQPGEQTRRMLDYMFPGYQRRDPRNWYEMQTQTDLDRYEINPLIGNELIETETVDLYEERKKSLLEKFPADDDLEDEDEGSPEAEKRPPAKKAHRSSVVSRTWEGPPIRMAGKSSQEGFHLEVEDYYHDPQTILVPKEVIEHRELKMDIVPDEQGVPKVIIYLGPKEGSIEEMTEEEVEQPQETIILYDGKEEFDEYHSSDEIPTSTEESPVPSEHEIPIIEETPSPERSLTPVSEESISPEPEPESEPEPHLPTPEPEPVPVPLPVLQPPADESASVVYILPPLARDSIEIVGPSVMRIQTPEPEPSITSSKEEEVAVPEEITEKVNSILLEPIQATGSHEDIYEEIIGETPPESIPEPIPEVKELSPIPSEKGVHSTSPRDQLFSPLENYPNNLDEEPYKPQREFPRNISTSSPSSAKSPPMIPSKGSYQSPSPGRIDHPLKVLDDHPPTSPTRSSTPDSKSSDVSRWLDSAIISQAKDVAKPLARSPNPERLDSPKNMSATISPDKLKPKSVDMNQSPISSTSPDRSDFATDEKINEWLEQEIVKPSEVNNWVESKILSTAKKPDDKDRKPPKRDSTSPGNEVDDQIDEWMDREILQPAQQKRLVRKISVERRPVKKISVASEEPESADEEIESWIGNEIVQPAEAAVWVDKEIMKPIHAEKWLKKQILQPASVDSYVDRKIVKPASDEAIKWPSSKVAETDQQPVEDAVKQDSEEKPPTFFQPEVEDESKSLTKGIEEGREKSPIKSPVHYESPEKIQKKSFEVSSGIPIIPSISTTSKLSSYSELKASEKPPTRSFIDDDSEPERSMQEVKKPLTKREQEEPSRVEAPLEAPMNYLSPFQPHPDHPDDFPRAQNLIQPGQVMKVTRGDKEPQPEPLNIKTHDDSAMRDKGMMSQEGIAEAKPVIDKGLESLKEMSKKRLSTQKKEPSEGGLKRKQSFEPSEGGPSSNISPGSSISKLEKLDRTSILAKKALETNNYLMRDEDDDYSKPRGSTGSVGSDKGDGKSNNGKKKCPIGSIFKKKKKSTSPSPFSRNFANASIGTISPESSSKKVGSLDELVKSSSLTKKDTLEMPSNITPGESLSAIQESSKEFDSTPTKMPPSSSLAQTPDDEKNKSDTGQKTTPYAPDNLNEKSTSFEQKPYSLPSAKPTMSSKTDGFIGTAMIPEKQASLVLPDDILTTTYPKFVDTVDKVDKKKKSDKEDAKLPDPPKKGYPEFPDYKDLISPKEYPEPAEVLASKRLPAEVPKVHSDNAENKTDSPLTTSSFTQTQNFEDTIKKSPTASSITVSLGDTGIRWISEPPSMKDHEVATVKKVGEPENLEFASSTEPLTPGDGIPRFPDYDEYTIHPQHAISGQPIPPPQIRPPTSSPQSVSQDQPYPPSPQTPSFMNQPTHSQQQMPAPNLPSSRPYNVTQPPRSQLPPSARPTVPRQQDSVYSPYRPVQPPYYANQSQLRAWKRPDDSRPQQVPIESTRPQGIPKPSEHFHTKPQDPPMLIKHEYSHPEKPLEYTSERHTPLFEQQTPSSKPVMDSARKQVPDYSSRYVPRNQQEPITNRKPQFEKAQIPPSASFKPSQQHSVPRRSFTVHPDQLPALKEYNYTHPDQPLPLIYGLPSNEQLQSDIEDQSHPEFESHSSIATQQERDSKLNKPMKPGKGVPKFPDYPDSRPAEQHPPMMTGDHLPKEIKPKIVTAAEKKTEIDNEMLPIMQQIADLKRRMYELTPEKGPPIVTGPGHTSRRLPTSRQLYDELETRTMDATKDERARANAEKRKQVYEENARRKIQRAIERSQQNKR